MTRTFTEVAKKHVSQAPVVTNKPGASGGIGLGEVQRAAPEGYKVRMLISDLAIIPHLAAAAVEDPAFKEAMARNNLLLSYMEGEQFKPFMADQSAYFKLLLGKVKIEK